jgi:hypothetical protein
VSPEKDVLQEENATAKNKIKTTFFIIVYLSVWKEFYIYIIAYIILNVNVYLEAYFIYFFHGKPN